MAGFLVPSVSVVSGSVGLLAGGKTVSAGGNDGSVSEPLAAAGSAGTGLSAMGAGGDAGGALSQAASNSRHALRAIAPMGLFMKFSCSVFVGNEGHDLSRSPARLDHSNG